MPRSKVVVLASENKPDPRFVGAAALLVSSDPPAPATEDVGTKDEALDLEVDPPAMPLEEDGGCPPVPAVPGCWGWGCWGW
jgi:hypothetical protein